MWKFAFSLLMLLVVALPTLADETSIAQALQQRVRAFHEGAPQEELKLRVIYFYPADREPQPNYQARVNRIVLDIKDFYDTEFARVGLKDAELPLEMEGEQVKIHMVKGAENHDSYGYDVQYGLKMLREIGQQLRGQVDPEREFLLILCGLCDKQENDVYKIYSPYYGLGGANQVRGICFAADCEMLDTLNLTKTKEPFRYNEHNRDQRRSLADFNTVFIGGMAHELGHGLSLPHNHELSSERSKGTALMGSGNYTYRAELVGKQGSFMTLASATRMMCHPLLTQSNKQRFDRGHVRVSDVTFSGEGKALTVKGKVESNIEPFAVIAYSDAEGGSNYDAFQWTQEVQPDGTFEITLDEHKPGQNALRLDFCHANGATSEVSYHFTANEKGEPNIQALRDSLIVGDIEQKLQSGEFADAKKLATEYLQSTPETSIAEFLKLCQTYEGPTTPIALPKVTTNEVFLSDVIAANEEVEFGRPTRNAIYRSRRDRSSGFFLKPGGQFHGKGLYAHAKSSFTFELDENWKTFTAVAGLQPGPFDDAEVVFIVKGDGKELYRSEKIGGNQVAPIDLDISGVKQLELIAESAGPNNRGCWSVWGSPKISR
ncbi:NPCBM/NEW2 domain-containing protein [Blastopirellula marina]|uniref:Glycosyl hydrolase family 98 putative carbohydrate-binding module domain-containing protein n=1 Tax=Blastopirellula marina TaxID=124 RepID=A0A2S8G9J0_9BACT|nr:NPCBM/NEW2 domain-containing protein [Blastopirellula marina]PQO40970.1 hypothetical protein C5Y98_05165 [Blastopirellula marina]PTL45853.1 hypothetical protein C5Y97_05165 [Blastopirellula marina]